MMNVKTIWPTVELGSLASFRNGLNYSKANFGKGLKVINVGDFGDRSTPDYGSLDEINPVGISRAESLLQKNDILFVRSNGNRGLIGRSMMLKETPPFPVSHSAFTIRARLEPNQVSPEFFSYVFRSPLIRSVLSAHGNGANISNLNQDILSQLKVPLPSLKTQKQIGTILSAYDNLIENNTRRIAILEEMARRIYDEWFVRFRFPGHEQVKMAESELGLISEGAEKTRLGDLIEFKKGKKPLIISDSPAEGLLPHLLIDALRGSDKREYAPVEKAVSVRDNDTIMVMDGSGSCDVFVGHNGVIGSTLGRYRAIDPRICPYWLYLFFHVNQSQIKAKNIGAAIPHANKDFISSMELFLPPSETIQAFDEKIQSIFGLIKKLRLKNANLRTTRDLLLPKLISGELDVSTLPAPEEAIA